LKKEIEETFDSLTH